MTVTAPNNENGRWTDLFPATTSAEKRVEAGSGPALKGSARGKILQLVGQQRPALITPKKVDPPKPSDKPVGDQKDDKTVEKAKDEKENGKKGAKTAESLAA